MKAPDNGHAEGVLARIDTWTLDGLGCMENWTDRLVHGYTWQLRTAECSGTHQATTVVGRSRRKHGTAGFHSW